jgi:hypothetical protein
MEKSSDKDQSHFFLHKQAKKILLKGVQGYSNPCTMREVRTQHHT